MNVSLPKLSVMLALLLLPFWQWAQPSSLETYQNTSVSFDFVSNPNNPGLSNPNLYGPFNGEVTIVETSNFNYTFTYTPDEGFTGTDNVRLGYWSSFPISHLTYANITISVEPALIRAYHDYASTVAGQPVTINVLDNDLSSNGIKILRAVPAVNHGTATYTEGEASVIFTPKADYQGLAHFNYVLCNGLGDCDDGTVSVSVMGTDEPEEDEVIQVFTKKNKTEFILVPNEYSLVAGPVNGTFDPGADVPEYTPAADFVGLDEIRFSQGNHEVIYAIEVLDLKENVFAFEDRAFTTLNAEVSINVLDNDFSISGSCLSYTQPEHGVVNHPTGSPAGYFEYTPDPGFVGVDEFTYTSYLTACSGEPETATVYVFVSNFEPDRSTFYMSTPEATPIIIGYNVPVSTFRFEVSSQGDFGEAFFLSGNVNTTINGANIVGQNMLIYVPDEGVVGETDEFEITYCLEDPSSNACVVSKTVKIYMDILDIGGGNGPVCVGDCVWPGDTNFDGVVSMADLLPIGLSMGEVGSERLDATMNHWYGQYADDWGNLFGGQNNTSHDLKHIDADGNSIVTAHDTSAINLFYGRTHTMVPQVMPYAPYDFILEGPLFVEPGDLVEIRVKIGASGIPAEDVYGFVFPYTYNPEFMIPESVRVNWHSNSWLNYNSPVLHMQHNSLAGFLESGYTRTSGISASGHGEIGVLEAIITDDIIGFRNDKEEIILPMGGMDGQAMNSAGQMAKVYIQPFNLRIRLNDEHTGLRDEQLKTFPNPTSQYLTVHLNGRQEFEALQLFSMTGQVVKTIIGLSTNHAELDLSQLPNGIYILQVKTTDGILNRKIEVLH